MGYQNKSRPDNKDPKDLLVDARMDLQDLKYWVDEGGNPKDLGHRVGSWDRDGVRDYYIFKDKKR
jgi:hypothetical protein